MLDIIQIKDEIVVKGELTRRTISPAFEKKSYALITPLASTLNLSAVSKIDTAGMAWLLMVLEIAKKAQHIIEFTHLPKELIKLAKLSGVDLFLPVK